MRQYWINFKGNQQGPMSMEEMAQLGLDSTAYVWYSGLPDWVKITNVPELEGILNNAGSFQQVVPELPQEPITNEVTLQDQQPTTVEDNDQQGLEDVPPLDVIDYSGYNSGEPSSNFQPQQQYTTPQQQYATPQQNYPMPAQNMPEQEPCPPTNLVWAIIATVLCCTVAGIVGIVFAFLTKKHYREGNIEKAKRMSDYGAWAIIASIILGLISMPLSCTMNMVKMGMGIGG